MFERRPLKGGFWAGLRNLQNTPPPREAFLDIVLACPPDHFEVSDVAVLAEYCEVICQAKEANAKLKQEGYVQPDGKPSVWINVQAHARRTISTYSRLLRLNPSTRQTTPASDREPPVVSA
jgi:hypothetical protein